MSRPVEAVSQQPVWVLAVGTFASGTAVFVVAGIVPDLSDDLGISVGASGQLVLAFALSYALLAPVLAAATARVAPRMLMLSGLAIFVAGNALTAVAPALGWLLAGRVIAAAGVALYTPTAYAAAALLAGRDRQGRALATVLGGFTLAAVSGVPLGTAVAAAFSWRETLWLVTALSLAALVLVAAAGPAPSRSASPLPGGLVQMARDPRVLRTLAVTSVAVATSICVYTYIAPIVEQTAGIAGDELAYLLLAWGAGGLLGTTLSGRATDRFGARPTLLCALVAMTAVQLLLPLASGPLVVGVMLAHGWSSWSFTVPQQTRLLDIAPGQGNVVMSMNATGIYVGQGLGAAAGALALDQLGVAPGWLAPLAAVGGLVALALAIPDDGSTPNPRRLR